MNGIHFRGIAIKVETTANRTSRITQVENTLSHSRLVLITSSVFPFMRPTIRNSMLQGTACCKSSRLENYFLLIILTLVILRSLSRIDDRTNGQNNNFSNVIIVLFLSEISLQTNVKNTSVIFRIYFFSDLQFVLDIPLHYDIIPAFLFCRNGQNNPRCIRFYHWRYNHFRFYFFAVSLSQRFKNICHYRFIFILILGQQNNPIMRVDTSLEKSERRCFSRNNF